MRLQRQPNQKAADLAAELNVSERTLHRYIGMLEEVEVLEPAELRETVRNWATAVAEQYK